MYHAQGPEVILLRIFSYACRAKKILVFMIRNSTDQE
ncbi:hypothetical protein GBAR_LOCUS30236 [Geodia barretti]|uniref:Uncharacterized protein n=1 Tax=Geodia barretti TaxID=519541 RepID=A0AA35TVQ1_GEOBA|nr:hypothetical protein GBAR_LOCUS30236 [Geodia barretti]